MLPTAHCDVVWRQCSVGTHREAGSQCVERILTVVTTLRQQRRDVLDYLTAACTAAIHNAPAPALLPLTAPPSWLGNVRPRCAVTTYAFFEREQQGLLTHGKRTRLNALLLFSSFLVGREDTVARR